MESEIELLNKRIDAPENIVWRAVSLYWEAFNRGPHFSAFALDLETTIDIRNIERWHGDLNGIEIEISFPQEGERLFLVGITKVGSGRYSRREHVIGYVDVRCVLLDDDNPVDVRVICKWNPFYLFFKGLADFILSFFTQQPVNQAINEVIEFKALVERQIAKDIYVNRQPQENIARALLQAFLKSRSYREVPVRGGKSDLITLDREGRFLYETKIWRGKEYFIQGLREIEEYIIGEDSDNKLAGVFYIIFDPTESSSAHIYRGSDLTTEIIASRTVQVMLININPPKPSKKQ